MAGQPVTYQQLLAEQYEENARDLLVYQETDYHNVEEENINPHNANHQVGVELENPHEFQQFLGNRNKEEYLVKAKEFNDKGITSVRYRKDVQINIFSIDTTFRSYATPGTPAPPASLVANNPVGSATVKSTSDITTTSSTSHFVINLEKLYQNNIRASLTSFSLPNKFFNIIQSRKNYYIYVKSGIYNVNDTFSDYTQITLPLADTTQNPLFSLNSTELNALPELNGYYYSNTSVIPALNKVLNTAFPDLTCTYSNGYCVFNNSSSSITYTLNFTPDLQPLEQPLFPKLGKMLGFRSYLYELAPNSNTNAVSSDCFSCATISPCQCYGNITSEDQIDMNADPFIYLYVLDWNNFQVQDSSGGYFPVFTRIPINVPKGTTIYDMTYNNSTTRHYDFLQPTDIQRLEISLYDKVGNYLIMPGVEWCMTLETEEVLNRDLYEKMREL
jgi:hypothetical protein